MLKAEEISRLIKERIQRATTDLQSLHEGIILSVSDGIVKVYGLTSVMAGEMVQFQDGGYGIALNLEGDVTSVVVIGDGSNLEEGQKVSCTGEVLAVPVGEALLGRVVNALGEPIDGKGSISTEQRAPIEKIAPGVIERQSVDQPLATGIKAIDAMVPIGRGQRELIIGDRQTGKTSIALDAILNQRNTGVKCVYVAVGQKAAFLANVVRRLEEQGAMSYTIVVAALASDSAAEQYLSVYAATSMAEFFRDRGEDVLIIYDDLTKHAWAYRQISLLLRRPPGREAYPGDIFYLHSRLLERAAKVNAAYVERMTKGKVTGKTGSITALPIVETQAGDVTSFVPTNIISITDGQIFLDTDLFNSGMRPAIDAGLSVSRVGGAAQTKLIKRLGQGLRLMLAQYRELEAFAQFAAELDETTSNTLKRGAVALEILKQNRFKPLDNALMAASLFLIDQHLLDNVEIKEVLSFEQSWHQFLRANYAELLARLNCDESDYEDLLKKLKSAAEEFSKEWDISRKEK